MIQASILDGSVQEDLTNAKDNDVIASLLDIGDHVRRQDGTRCARGDRFAQHMEELLASQRIEVRQWLVEEEDPRPSPDCERKGHLCLLSARQLAATAVKRYP